MSVDLAKASARNAASTLIPVGVSTTSRTVRSLDEIRSHGVGSVGGALTELFVENKPGRKLAGS